MYSTGENRMNLESIVIPILGILALTSFVIYYYISIISILKYYLDKIIDYYITKYKKPAETNRPKAKPETWNADYEAWRAEKLKKEAENSAE